MPGASVFIRAWAPERREFTVQSPSGGLFTLAEQKFPGWAATVDGKPSHIELWNDVFQAVRAPAGEHRITFTYHSRLLPWGALISSMSMIALGWVAFRERLANHQMGRFNLTLAKRLR